MFVTIALFWKLIYLLVEYSFQDYKVQSLRSILQTPRVAINFWDPLTAFLKLYELSSLYTLIHSPIKQGLAILRWQREFNNKIEGIIFHSSM